MTDQQQSDIRREQRSLTTDVAIVAAPTIAVVANHLLNKPSDSPPEPPKIELPPGVEKE